MLEFDDELTQGEGDILVCHGVKTGARTSLVVTTWWNESVRALVGDVLRRSIESRGLALEFRRGHLRCSAAITLLEVSQDAGVGSGVAGEGEGSER